MHVTSTRMESRLKYDHVQYLSECGVRYQSQYKCVCVCVCVCVAEACRPGIPAFVQSYERLCKEYPRVQSEGGWQQVPSTSRRPVSPSPSQAAPTLTPQAVTGTQSEEWERNNAYAGLARMSAD